MNWRLIVVAALAAGVSGAQAQTPPPAPPPGPVYVVSYIEIAPSAKRQVRAMLRSLRETSRKEAGSSNFEVFERIDRPQHFLLIETWKDAKAQSDHAAAAGTKQFRETLKPLLTAPYDERPSFGFMVGEAKSSGMRTLYAVTHVDFVGAKKDDGLAALKQLGTDSTKEAGVQRFDILQQNNRQNHVTLVEAWRGMSALEAHERGPASKKFRDQLLPIGGALFDQRLYRAVQ